MNSQNMRKINLKETLTTEQTSSLIGILKTRFEKNMHRHKSLKWFDI